MPGFWRDHHPGVAVEGAQCPGDTALKVGLGREASP